MKLLQSANNYITHYFLSFFELQFVISLMSLPVLIAWGIPISIMSPLANLIFTPLLILFLWISCLATVWSLASCSTSIFEQLLDAISALWLYFLAYARPEWLIGFPDKMLYLSIMICASIVVLYTYFKPKPFVSVIMLCLIWLAMIALRPCFTPHEQLQRVGELPLYVCQIQDTAYLIDYGALCTRKNRHTNFDYTILPQLIKSTGRTTIDTVIFCKPSSKMAKVAQLCHEQLKATTFIVTPSAQCFEHVHEHFKHTSVKVLKLSPKRKASKNKSVPSKS